MVIEKCQFVRTILKSIAPWLETSLSLHEKGCAVDYKDNKLFEKISKDSGADYAGIFGSRGSASFYNEKAEADLPINMFSKERKAEQLFIGSIVPELKTCKIKEVHIHNGNIPATHVRIECSPVDETKTPQELARVVKKSSEISRDIIGII